MASDSDKNVIEISRLKLQFVNVATELLKLLAHRGYISEFIVHGIGPIPVKKRYKLSGINNHKIQNART